MAPGHGAPRARAGPRGAGERRCEAEPRPACPELPPARVRVYSNILIFHIFSRRNLRARLTGPVNSRPRRRLRASRDISKMQRGHTNSTRRARLTQTSRTAETHTLRAQPWRQPTRGRPSTPKDNARARWADTSAPLSSLSAGQRCPGPASACPPCLRERHGLCLFAAKAAAAAAAAQLSIAPPPMPPPPIPSPTCCSESC